MPLPYNQQEETDLQALIRLNPEIHIDAINKKLSNYFSQYEGDSDQYTPEKAQEYRRLLEEDLVRRKEKAEKSKSAIVPTANNNRVKKQTGAATGIISDERKANLVAAAAASNPALGVAAHVGIGAVNTTAKTGKKVFNATVKMATEVDLRKNAARGLSGAGALVVGGAAAGLAAQTLATGAEVLTRGAVQSAFSGVTGNSGILGTIMTPVVNATSSALGGVAGTVAGVVLPLALLYIAVPRLYKLFFYGFKLGINAWDNRNTPVDLSLLPEEGPLLELIGHLSTLAMIEKLDTELKLKGIANLKFNISNLFQKILHPGSNPALSKEEQALYELAKKNAKSLITISKKANDPQKLKKYQNLQSTQNLIKTIENYLPENFNQHRALSKQMRFCLTIIGTLIHKEYEAHIQQSFFVGLKVALENTRQHRNITSSSSSPTYQNIGPNRHAAPAHRSTTLSSSASSHTYESIDHPRSAHRSAASSTTSHSTATTTARDVVISRQAAANNSTRSGERANRVPLAARAKFFTPPAVDGKSPQAKVRGASNPSTSVRRS